MCTTAVQVYLKLVSNGLRYATELIDGVTICADFYGTNSECQMLDGLKRRLENSGHYELNMWRFIVSFIKLLADLNQKGYC